MATETCMPAFVQKSASCHFEYILVSSELPAMQSNDNNFKGNKEYDSSYDKYNNKNATIGLCIVIPQKGSASRLS